MIQFYLETKQQKYFEEIVIKFKPLLHCYSKKLYDLEYEDSFQELTLTLYEAILHIKQVKNEYSCLLYIKKSILHKFYSLYDQSKKLKHEKSKIDNIYFFNSLESQIENCLFQIDIKQYLKNKRRLEYIVFYKAMLGYTDTEIAVELGYSRQYINKIKKCIFYDTIQNFS